MSLIVHIFHKLRSNTKSPLVYYKKSKFLLGSGKTLYQFCSRFASDSMQYDSILLIVDRLTNSAHFIFFKSIYSVKDYARIFIDEIVFFHGISLSIILDRGR